MTMKKLALALAATGLVSLSLTACGGKEATAPAASAADNKAQEQTGRKHPVTGEVIADVQELVIGNGAEPASIDPGKIEGQPGGMVAYQLFEGLTSLNEKGEVIPGAAESWTATNENKTWTFVLREGLKWSNGDPVKAQDFVYAWQRVADPATASSYSWYMEVASIINATEVVGGEKAPSELGVMAKDDRTLEVQLSASVPYFPSIAAHYTMYPVHKGTVDMYGAEWTKPGNMVSNGAYKLSTWNLGERMELVKNDQYWNASNVVVDKVTMLPIEDESAELIRFESGEIHATSTTPNDQIPRLKREHADKLTIYPNLAVYYYDFNTEVPPTNNPLVRKALSLAIDRDIIVNAVTKGGQQPAYSFVPPFVAGFKATNNMYEKMTQAQRDEEAKKLLAEAGYGPENPLNLDFLYNTSDGHKSIAVAVSQMWKEKLGVEMALENQEWKTFLETRKAGNFHVARSGWGGDYNEASTFLDLLTSTHGNNDSNFKNAEYDRLMKESRFATDANQYYAQAEAILAAEMPVAPIYFYTRVRMIQPNVKGWPVGNAQDVVYMKDLYLTK